MDSIGAEVGHKMRSAIKAKLMELDCYVDEELPDYIMVMVANRRSKSQMTEDLNLFLSAKTSTFVNWLHIVLKKLKEVTVTNPEVYQKALKRKNDVPVDDKSSLKVKKEKSHKKIKNEEDVSTSMTDDLPISNLAKNRKIIVENCKDSIVDDNFDIPLLSEVADSVNEQELQDIEKKIKSVKSRLGLLVDSDEEVKNENGGVAEITSTKQHQIEAEPSVSEEGSNKPKHKRITFENEPVLSRSRDKSPNNQSASGRKPSILDRLGKRPGRDAKATINRDDRTSSRDKSSVSSRLGYRKGEGSSRYRNDSRSRSRSPLDSRSRKNDTDGESIKEGILSRLGVQSKVAVVKKAPPEPVNDNEEEEQVVREVQSSIKVKPRVIPSDAVQPNKNLLLKAVAEAQRSVAQTPKVGKEPSKITSLDKIKNNILHRLSPKPNARDLIKKSSDRMRSRLQLSSDDDDYDSEGEYVPKSVGKLENVTPIYVPSANHSQSNSQHNDLATNDKQQFIITLDGIENTGFISKLSAETLLREDGTVNKRVPSPIVFNKTEISATEIVTTRPDIPDVLPVVRPPLSVKNKERCKYWPGCKHGDRCEFVHPSESCQLFPHCKFGDRCIFLHPKCKFAASCTKRDCPYDHVTNKLIPAKVTVIPSMQNCKFFPNCTNPKCQFYHPKPCKYGKFCNNTATCTFSHPTANNRKNFSWTAK